MPESLKKILHNNGSPSADDMGSRLWRCSSSASVWISDLAFVLSWTTSSSSALWPTAFDTVHSLLQSSRNVTVFWYEAKSFPAFFSSYRALFRDLAMNCPEGIFQKHQILLYVSFFVTILLSFRFNSSLTSSLRNSRVNRTFHCLPPPLFIFVLWHDLFILFIPFQLVLYLSFF